MLRSAPSRLAASAAALLLLASGAVAQDAASLFADGVQAYRTGDSEAAIEAFKDALAQDPGNEEVFRFWQTTEQDVLTRMMLERGELGALAKRVLGKTKLGRDAVLSDPGGARDLVETYLTADLVESQRALLELTSGYGEWAVPALVGPLGDRSDGDRRVAAIKALIRLGDRAVPGLIQVLRSDDQTTRTNAAATLGSIGDLRAAAGLAWMAANDDAPTAKAVAAEALAKLRPALADAGLDTADPETLSAGLARHWLVGSGAVAKAYSTGRVAWSWDGGLQGEPILGGLYNLHLAQDTLSHAMAHGAGPAVASTSAAVLAAMVAEIRASADLEGLDAGLVDAASAALPSLEMGLAAAGTARGPALALLLENDQLPAAEALIGSMGRSQGEQAALRQALNGGQGGVRVAAALTLASQGFSGPAVVATLADALTQVPDRLVLSIGDTGLSGGAQGWAVQQADSVAVGLTRAKRFPPKEVVVVRDGADGVTLDAVVFGLRNDPRTADVPLIVVSDDADAVEARYSGTVARAVSAVSLEDVAAVAGDDDARRAAAMDRATRAAHALAGLPGNVVASASAQAAAALASGDDAVRTAVLGLVGHAGMGDALTAVEGILLEGGSQDLMTAACDAAAQLWALHGGPRGDAEALASALALAMAEGGDLAQAAARAYGYLGPVGGSVG